MPNVGKSKVMHTGREEEEVLIHCERETLKTTKEYPYFGLVTSGNSKYLNGLS